MAEFKLYVKYTETFSKMFSEFTNEYFKELSEYIAEKLDVPEEDVKNVIRAFGAPKCAVYEPKVSKRPAIKPVADTKADTKAVSKKPVADTKVDTKAVSKKPVTDSKVDPKAVSKVKK